MLGLRVKRVFKTCHLPPKTQDLVLRVAFQLAGFKVTKVTSDCLWAKSNQPTGIDILDAARGGWLSQNGPQAIQRKDI